ncbi:hypothetical protein G6F36_013132 [Rhizopus arrhizus]|nr:hypothetical protein G6F36_013132 [Rhizopus arrhizus]
MFSETIDSIQYVSRDNLDLCLGALHAIKKSFESDASTRDAFRREGGFTSLVSKIVGLKGAFEEPQRYIHNKNANIEAIHDKIVLVLQNVFSVLTKSLHQHEINKHCFIKDVGYEAVENVIILTDALSHKHITEPLFGILFYFASENEAMLDLFITATPNSVGSNDVPLISETDIIYFIELKLNESIVFIASLEIMPLILRLQDIVSVNVQLSQTILYTLFSLSQGSRGKQIKLNKFELILPLLERLFIYEQTQRMQMSNNKEIFDEYHKKPDKYGVSSSELCYIFKKLYANKGDDSPKYILDLILHEISSSRRRGFIQFNSHNG